MVSSSGKSSRKRRAICSGLHALAHRRGRRPPRPRPFPGTPRPRTPAPPPPPPPPATPPPPHPPARPAPPTPARPTALASQPLLHVPPQRRVHSQLRRLRASGRPLGMPLRGRGPILQTAAARGGVAPQLTRDRGRRTPQPSGGLPHPTAPRPQQRKFLAFRKRQIPLRWRLR